MADSKRTTRPSRSGAGRHAPADTLDALLAGDDSLAAVDRVLAFPLEPWFYPSNDQLAALAETFTQLDLALAGLVSQDVDDDTIAALRGLLNSARQDFEDLEFALHCAAARAARRQRRPR